MIKEGVVTIFVSDMDRAVAFYSETLGLTLEHRYENHWAQINAGGCPIGLHGPGDGPTPGTPGSIQLGLSVEGSIEDCVTALEARGVTFKGPIVDDGPVKLAFFGDPDGNELYLAAVDAG